MRLLAVLGAASAMLGACAGPIPTIGSPVAGYTRSNAFLLAGYSEKSIDTTHYEVSANGTQATPKARVEKIAMTRAAEIGVEGKQRYFRVVSVQHGMRCGKKQELYKGPTQPALRYPTVTLDVIYANGAAPPDASWQVSADAHARLAEELRTEAVASDESVAVAADVKGQCGAT